MRICYLANGQTVHIQKWMKYFVSRGHEVYLVTFNKTGYINNIDIQVLRYSMKFAYPLRILNIKKMIKKIHPDIFHAHYVSHYGIYGALTNFTPFVVTAWGSDILIDPKKSIITKYFVKYALKKADLITADSVSLIKAIRRLGVDGEKIKLIIHGVDLRLFHPVEDNEIYKKELHIPEDYQIVISTRNLKPVYDIGTLIKAIPYVINKYPNTYFLIIGEGILKHQLEEMVYKLGVAKNVRFVGLVPNRKIPTFLKASDIYVSTSLSDTRSVSMLEAMACGLPIVTTDLEANKECIKNGIGGYLIPKKNYKVLAEKIIYLLGNKDIRKRFGVINRKYVEREGNYEKEMRKMEKLYEELIEVYRT